MESDASPCLHAFLAGLDDAPALIDGQRRCTRSQLRDAAQSPAQGLQSLGSLRGDAVAVWLPNGAAWLQLLFAAARLGVCR